MPLLRINEFFLLRGNHEIRAIQMQFTFYNECRHKFGETNGQKVFQLINSVFDVMQIATSVDETIFRTHGGIPYSINRIEALLRFQFLSKIQNINRRPVGGMPSLLFILWLDPISNEEYKQLKEFMHLKEETGFISNTKRSTAFFYSEKVINDFFKINGLSHMIRPHEMEIEGFRFHLNYKVITIFMSSHYCSQNNRAAAAFIDGNDNNGLIQIIQLET